MREGDYGCRGSMSCRCRRRRWGPDRDGHHHSQRLTCMTPTVNSCTYNKVEGAFRCTAPKLPCKAIKHTRGTGNTPALCPTIAQAGLGLHLGFFAALYVLYLTVHCGVSPMAGSRWRMGLCRPRFLYSKVQYPHLPRYPNAQAQHQTSSLTWAALGSDRILPRSSCRRRNQMHTQKQYPIKSKWRSTLASPHARLSCDLIS